MYTTSAVGNGAADFVMIVASMCGVNLTEVVIALGSEEEKALQKRHSGAYPILEIDENTLFSDSHVIAAYLCRSSGNENLLGATIFEQAEVEQWMEFVRTETVPIVNALKWYTFGQVKCDSPALFAYVSE